MRTLQDSNSNIERRSALICNALNRYKIDIAAICETRLPGTSQMEEIGEGYTIFWTGKSVEEHRQSGVSFAIKSHIARSLSSFPKGVNDRIMILLIDIQDNTAVTLISCYTPTINAPKLKSKPSITNSIMSSQRYLIKTNFFLWGTSMLVWAMTIKLGRAFLVLMESKP